MAGKGYDIEIFFRRAFSIDESVDLLSLIDAAMSVAAFKYPEELARRTSGIDKTLAAIKARRGERADPKKIDDHEMKPKPRRFIIRIPAKKGSLSDKKNTGAVPKSEDSKKLETSRISAAVSKSIDFKKLETKKTEAKDDQSMRLKLSSSKRKLHERYEHLEKSRKKTQVLDIKDLPKLPCERVPIRRRLRV